MNGDNPNNIRLELQNIIGLTILCVTLLSMRLFKNYYYKISSASHHFTYGHQVFKIVVRWKHLCFRFCSSRFLVCGSIYELVYPIMMGPSSSCVVSVMALSQQAF
jgi:hypothetical protein